MIAGQNILYLPGTLVNYDGYMHGYITIDGQYCGVHTPSMVDIAAREGVIKANSERTFFKIYPNPTDGLFTLELTGLDPTEKLSIEIYGVSGNNVLSKDLMGEKKHEFSLADAPMLMGYLYDELCRTKNHLQIDKHL